jgi:hypothetical protein
MVSMDSCETKCASLKDGGYNMVHITMRENYSVDEDDIKEHVEACLKFSKGVPKKILFDVTKVQNLSNGGFKQLLDERLNELTIAVAVLVGLRSPLVSMAMSFLLKLERDPFPIKVFTDKKEALKWLKNI